MPPTVGAGTGSRYGPSNTEISGEAPSERCFVRCISLLSGEYDSARWSHGEGPQGQWLGKLADDADAVSVPRGERAARPFSFRPKARGRHAVLEVRDRAKCAAVMNRLRERPSSNQFGRLLLLREVLRIAS